MIHGPPYICEIIWRTQYGRTIEIHDGCQCIAWLGNVEQTIKDFRLLTFTCGTLFAPYLAIKTLRQLEVDKEQAIAIAANAIPNDFNVIDFLSGSESCASAVENKIKLLVSWIVAVLNFLRNGRATVI